MKPLFIKMHNIGPFKDESLDFTKLENMFLIFGNTGAGKTSIFDAMTYALYGVLNGSRKGNVRAFRSDFVSGEELASVEFIFEIAYIKYRVYRTLPQSYTTRNGTAAEKAVVLGLESSSDGKTFTAFSGTISETNGQIEKIIGLNAAEFSRIVLLPQGAFADFLHENSKDRRDTLEKLFPVNSYTAVTDEVKALSEENIRQLDAVAAQIAGCVKKYNTDTADEELKRLHKEQQELENNQKEIMQQLSDLSASREKLTARYKAALQNDNNKKDLEKLQTKSGEINKIREKLSLAAEAAKLSEYIHIARQNENNRLFCSRELESAGQSVALAEQELSLLTAQKNLREAQKKSAEEADAELPHQRSRLAWVRQLAELRKKAEESENTELQAEKELENVSASAEKTFTAFMTVAESVLTDTCKNMMVAQILSLLLSAEQTAHITWTDAQIVQKNAEQRAALISEIHQAETNSAAAADAHEKAQQYAENTKKCIEDIENKIELQKRNNAACYLAASLSDGRPCPVCGSISHPSPVKPGPEILSLQDQLDTTRHNLELAQNDVDDKLQQKARAQKYLEEKREQLTVIPETPTVDEAQYSRREAEKIYKFVSEASKKAAQLANTYQLQQQQIQTLTRQFSTIKSDAAAARTALTQLADTIREVQGEQIPEEQQLSAAIAALEKTSQDGKTAYTEWNNSFMDSGRKKYSAQARFEELSRQFTEVTKSTNESSAILSTRLEHTPFKTPEEAETALLSEEEQKNLRQSVMTYDDEVKKITALMENTELTPPCDEIRKQIAESESEIQKIQSEQEKTVRLMQDVSVRYNTLQSYVTEKNELEAKRIELEKKAAPYKMLYNDLSGKNPKNIPFNSWALGMYFEQVVQYANKRFSSISSGRFTFKVLSDKSPGGGYKGLDLLVTDTFTGTDRDTSTLSGGETFMASISLALALTDIVQNRNGGVRLDSLFIDEGFGSLDEETMDCAIAVLNDLQETKMVGIISHIENMKTAVRSQVEIIKTAEGSHIKIY